jgi:hypothetical protein
MEFTTTGATQAPAAPAKNTASWEEKWLAVTTTIGTALPSTANRKARVRSLAENRSGPISLLIDIGDDRLNHFA